MFVEMLMSVGVLVELQFEHPPQAPVRRWVKCCHPRRTRMAAAVATISRAMMSCMMGAPRVASRLTGYTSRIPIW
jgi:hypothetical protein